MVEVKAQLYNLRMSPKKVRLVAHTIKGLPVSVALARLRFTHKASAPVVLKLLRSALANARHNNNLEPDSLFVRHIAVNESIAIKRWRPAAFGSAHPFKRRGSHVEIVLGLVPGSSAPAVTNSGTAPVAIAAVAATEQRTEKILSRGPRKRASEKSGMPGRSDVSRGSHPHAGSSHAKRPLTRTTSK